MKKEGIEKEISFGGDYRMYCKEDRTSNKWQEKQKQKGQQNRKQKELTQCLQHRCTDQKNKTREGMKPLTKSSKLDAPCIAKNSAECSHESAPYKKDPQLFINPPYQQIQFSSTFLTSTF